MHKLIFLVIALALGGTSCAKVQARTEPEMPLLAPPPPPPRVVETYADEPVPTIEPSPAETALATPPRTSPKPTATRADPVTKPEPARTEPERPVPAPPALTLKPAPGGETKTNASIRDLLGRAAKDLNRVNYTALNADGRAQYETARRFMQQAEDALKGGNVAFASKLADKAATMAAVLVR